jgi:hypothetical protein
MSSQKEDFYVLENIEVKKTGRVAVRQLASISKRTIELVEVTPAHENDGSWTKWVSESSLFLIVDGKSK